VQHSKEITFFSSEQPFLDQSRAERYSQERAQRARRALFLTVTRRSASAGKGVVVEKKGIAQICLNLCPIKWWRYMPQSERVAV